MGDELDVTKQSAVIGISFFVGLIFIVLALWKIDFSGAPVETASGEVVDVYHYIMRGGSLQKAEVRLGNGEIIHAFCNNCKRYQQVIAKKKKSFIFGKDIWEIENRE